MKNTFEKHLCSEQNLQLTKMKEKNNQLRLKHPVKSHEAGDLNQIEHPEIRDIFKLTYL